MAQYTVKITTKGITSMRIAYYNGSGTRVPSGTGYTTYTFSGTRSFTVLGGKNLYIYDIVKFQSGYDLPWTFKITGTTSSSSSIETSGTTSVINNNIYPTSNCTIQVTATAIGTRPDDWSWDSTIRSGSAIAITAAEWNDFCTRINEFREYAGLSSYSFTTVRSGTTISAAIVNQARTAINAISGHGTLPSAAVSGGAITASFFNTLVSALNSIP